MDIDKILYQVEAHAVRLERTIVRLWVLLIIMLVLLVGTNALWICYESSFEDITTTIEAEQETDGSGSNYIVNGNYGETEGKSNN